MGEELEMGGTAIGDATIVIGDGVGTGEGNGIGDTCGPGVGLGGATAKTNGALCGVTICTAYPTKTKAIRVVMPTNANFSLLFLIVAL